MEKKSLTIFLFLSVLASTALSQVDKEKDNLSVNAKIESSKKEDVSAVKSKPASTNKNENCGEIPKAPAAYESTPDRGVYLACIKHSIIKDENKKREACKCVSTKMIEKLKIEELKIAASFYDGRLPEACYNEDKYNTLLNYVIEVGEGCVK